MKRKQAIAVFVAGLLSLILSQAPAAAFDGYSGLYNPPLFGVSGSLYGQGYVPPPPYFSLHPPVYYSHNVYRPYGLSPHAARRGGMKNYRSQKPQVVINPYVAEKLPELPIPAATATAPLMIINPYVKQPGDNGKQLVKLSDQ